MTKQIAKQRQLEPAKKFDANKARYDLLPAKALDEVVKIYTFGSLKYGDHNWRKGLIWSRVFGALMRHAWAFWRGEDRDKESGHLHLAHATWCCLTLIEYYHIHRKLDDRVKNE